MAALLQSHFHPISTSDITISEREFPFRVRADLQKAITHADRPFYLIDYRDGFKACVAMLQGVVGQFLFACRLKDQPKPLATKFALQAGPPYRHFEWLVKAIDHLINTRKPAYPVERTVLTTGIIDAAMRSLAQAGKRIETPQLDMGYRAAEWAPAPDRPPKPRNW